MASDDIPVSLDTVCEDEHSPLESSLSDARLRLRSMSDYETRYRIASDDVESEEDISISDSSCDSGDSSSDESSPRDLRRRASDLRRRGSAVDVSDIHLPSSSFEEESRDRSRDAGKESTKS